MRVVSICFAIGLSVHFANVFLGAALQERQIKRLIPGGIALPDSGVGHLLSTWVMLAALMVPVAFMGWLLPLIVRNDKKFEARVSVESLRTQQKKRVFMFGIKRKYGRFFGVACIALWVVIVLVTPKNGQNMLLHMSAMGGWIAGINLLGLGLFARCGRHLVCGRCDHEMRSWRSAGTKCSECGCMWKEPWNAQLGAKRVRWASICWGAGFAAVSLGYIVWKQAAGM